MEIKNPRDIFKESILIIEVEDEKSKIKSQAGTEKKPKNEKEKGEAGTEKIPESERDKYIKDFFEFELSDEEAGTEKIVKKTTKTYQFNYINLKEFFIEHAYRFAMKKLNDFVLYDKSGKRVSLKSYLENPSIEVKMSQTEREKILKLFTNTEDIEKNLQLFIDSEERIPLNLVPGEAYKEWIRDYYKEISESLRENILRKYEINEFLDVKENVRSEYLLASPMFRSELEFFDFLVEPKIIVREEKSEEKEKIPYYIPSKKILYSTEAGEPEARRSERIKTKLEQEKVRETRYYLTTEELEIRKELLKAEGERRDELLRKQKELKKADKERKLAFERQQQIKKAREIKKLRNRLDENLRKFNRLWEESGVVEAFHDNTEAKKNNGPISGRTRASYGINKSTNYEDEIEKKYLAIEQIKQTNLDRSLKFEKLSKEQRENPDEEKKLNEVFLATSTIVEVSKEALKEKEENIYKVDEVYPEEDEDYPEYVEPKEEELKVVEEEKPEEYEIDQIKEIVNGLLEIVDEQISKLTSEQLNPPKEVKLQGVIEASRVIREKDQVITEKILVVAEDKKVEVVEDSESEEENKKGRKKEKKEEKTVNKVKHISRASKEYNRIKQLQLEIKQKQRERITETIKIREKLEVIQKNKEILFEKNDIVEVWGDESDEVVDKELKTELYVQQTLKEEIYGYNYYHRSSFHQELIKEAPLPLEQIINLIAYNEYSRKYDEEQERLKEEKERERRRLFTDEEFSKEFCKIFKVEGIDFEDDIYWNNKNPFIKIEDFSQWDIFSGDLQLEEIVEVTTFIKGLISYQKAYRSEIVGRLVRWGLIEPARVEQMARDTDFIDGEGRDETVTQINSLFTGKLRFAERKPEVNITRSRGGISAYEKLSGWKMDLAKERFMTDLDVFITNTHDYALRHGEFNQELQKYFKGEEESEFEIDLNESEKLFKKEKQEKAVQKYKEHKKKVEVEKPVHLEFWELFYKLCVNLSYRLYQQRMMIEFILYNTEYFGAEIINRAKYETEGCYYKWQFHSNVWDRGNSRLDKLEISGLVSVSREAVASREENIIRRLFIKYELYRTTKPGITNTELTIILNANKIFEDSKKAIQSKFEFIEAVYNVINNGGIRYDAFRIHSWAAEYQTKLSGSFFDLPPLDFLSWNQLPPKKVGETIIFLYMTYFEVSKYEPNRPWGNWFVYNRLEDYPENMRLFMRQYPMERELWYYSCWGFILAYLCYLQHGEEWRVEIENYRDVGEQFKIGRLKEGVDKLVKYFKIGVIYEISNTYTKIIENKLHVVIKGNHIKLMEWTEVRKKYVESPSTEKICKQSIQSFIEKNVNPSVEENIFKQNSSIFSWEKCNQEYMELNKDENNESTEYIKFDDPRQLLFRRNCIYLDIEASTGYEIYQKPYYCHIICYGEKPLEQFEFTIKHYVDEEYVARQITNCIIAFYTKFKNNVEKPLTIWYFNGHRYEMTYLLKPILEYFNEIESYGSPTETKGYNLLDGAIKIKDVICLHGPSPLQKLAKSYNKNYQKRKEIIDITKISHPSYARKNIELIGEYCRYDVLATMELLERTFISYEDLSIEMASETKTKPISLSCISEHITASGLALHFMIHHFFKNPIYDNEPKYWKEIQRINYKGGITQIFRHVCEEWVISIDINSSYPYSMTFRMPWFFVKTLEPHEIEKANQSIENVEDLGFYELEFFDFEGDKVPGIPIESEDGLLYLDSWNRHFNEKTVYVWGSTLIELKCKYKIISGALYTNVNPETKEEVFYTRDYTEFMYKKKQFTNKNTEGAKYNTSKLMLNSTYGKLGQRPFNSFKLYKPNEINRGEFDNVHFFSEKSWGLLRETEGVSRPYVGDFARVASYITSKSRAHLCRVGNIIGLKNLVYCDTDSLYFLKTARMKVENLLHESELGKWKIEKEIKKCIFIAPKCGILLESEYGEGKWEWEYKWKGVPHTILNEYEKPEELYEQFKKEILKFADNIASKILLHFYTFERLLISSRWTKRDNKMIIERYLRNTTFKIKKQICEKTRAKGFRVT